MKILASVALLTLAATMHPPPTVRMEVYVLEDEVSSVVTGELHVWNAWLGTAISGEFMLSEAELETVRERAVTFFEEHNQVVIDGVVATPRVLSARAPQDYAGLPTIEVEVSYPIDSAPKRIDFRWDVYEETDLFEKKALPAMIKAGYLVEEAMFTPEEPGHIWHARDVAPRRPRVATVPAPPPIHLLLPLGSIGLLLATVVLWPVAGRLRVSNSLRIAVVVAGLGGAFLLRDVGTVAVDSPWAAVDAPDASEAQQIFERLHGNIYRAFDALSEDEIYDLLAVSVSPAVLDELYGDIYESLILRGDGGAVCRIDEIDRRELQISVPDAIGELPHFTVNCAWRVKGSVSHWGHEHTRINRYRANYTVRHDGHSWKIDEVEILDHSRIDDGD